MKVNSINYNLFTTKNVNSTKQTSFKGLFGPCSYESLDLGSCGTSDDTYYYYYPFKDETEKEIQQVKNQYSDSNYSCANPYKVHDPIQSYTSSIFIVKNPLPFTKKDFEDYKNANVSKLKRDIIDRIILENNLDINPH